MITASGKYFDILNPEPDLICIKDIASALSKICRFGGHTQQFYSVAQHSYKAAELAHLIGTDKSLARAVLLHDATEAYIGDVIKPLKNLIDDIYGPIEKRVSDAIAERFSVDFDAHHEQIKHYDFRMLFSEKKSLLNCDGEKWEGEKDYPTLFPIYPVDAFTAERKFLWMADFLGVA